MSALNEANWLILRFRKPLFPTKPIFRGIFYAALSFPSLTVVQKTTLFYKTTQPIIFAIFEASTQPFLFIFRKFYAACFSEVLRNPNFHFFTENLMTQPNFFNVYAAQNLVLQLFPSFKDLTQTELSEALCSPNFSSFKVSRQPNFSLLWKLLTQSHSSSLLKFYAAQTFLYPKFLNLTFLLTSLHNFHFTLKTSTQSFSPSIGSFYVAWFLSLNCNFLRSLTSSLI